ncbi:MAG: hypothetical protein BWY75_01661 [bacterium ADurb.Bin425]|nr:MAG: hypothetical protein BWY75_01661 [bacterium ADurb.Bin425]
MIEPPENEVPTGSMPETAKSKGDEPVQYSSYGAVLAAAQGNINIVSYPETQRHMPALPKLSNRAGTIGFVKVYWQFDAEHTR